VFFDEVVLLVPKGAKYHIHSVISVILAKQVMRVGGGWNLVKIVPVARFGVFGFQPSGSATIVLICWFVLILNVLLVIGYF